MVYTFNESALPILSDNAVDTLKMHKFCLRNKHDGVGFVRELKILKGKVVYQVSPSMRLEMTLAQKRKTSEERVAILERMICYGTYFNGNSSNFIELSSPDEMWMESVQLFVQKYGD